MFAMLLFCGLRTNLPYPRVRVSRKNDMSGKKCDEIFIKKFSRIFYVFGKKLPSWGNHLEYQKSKKFLIYNLICCCESLFSRRPTAITSAERIMVLCEMLSRMKYGKRRDQYGIKRLLEEKVFVDAYPLHEGPYEWTEFGKLSDRQLLAKFWGNIRCWYKEQPINLIEKYFGTEFAFYFAWVGYYVKMLMPLTVFSVLCILYGVVTIPTRQNARSHEICSSNLLMCPTCHYTHCKYESLRSSCVSSHVTYVLDNPATIALAIIISVWSTIFMENWQRSRAVLQLRWNVKSIEDDTLKRPEYLEHATETITETSEPRISNKVICVGYTITLLSLLLMLVLVISAVLGVMVYQTSINLILIRNSKEAIIFDHTRMIASVTGAIMIAIFIFIFRAIFRVVALKLTNLENHRTQKEYDNSYIFKRFSLEFINNYSAVFYIAFFRGRFFTHPGDMVKWTFLGGLASDMCDPTGCVMDLGLSLMIIMMSKIAVENFAQLLLPKIIAKLKKILAKIQHSEDLPVLYEKEYFMSATEQYFLVDEYLDMVIQYGFVVFFAAGFPLAPALAFFNNLLEIRVDASKLTKSHRRPIPRKTSDLGAWFGILQAITYIGVAVNALVIAFNSNCVQNEIYRHTNDQDLEGFLNSTLSAFAIEDFRILDKSTILERSMQSPKLCFYPGRRYPPDDEHKYELTKDYWFLLAMRFLVVLIFEGDGRKKVDYVIVIDGENLRSLETYINNLEGIGLEFEIAKGIVVEKDFILIHIPKRTLEHFGKVFDVGMEEGKINVKLKRFINFQAYLTPLSDVSKVRKKGEFTSSERILIVNKLLEYTKYGIDMNDIGLSKLIRIGIISTAYPLHDGPLKMQDYDLQNANNRQLLYHYWANFGVWYKEVPLDIIKTYFGSEIAFYFGWLDFFNLMLIPAAMFGILVVLASVVTALVKKHNRVMELCKATNMYICPSCQGGTLCHFSKTISDFCDYAKWDMVFDNHSTVVFAIFMSVWATFFLQLWRRRSSILKLRWEIKFEATEINARQGYLDRVTTKKLNYFTGRLEPHLPIYSAVARLAFSVSVCLFLICLVLAAVLGIIVLKMSMKSALMALHYFKYYSKFITMCLGCLLQVIFIKLFGMIYGKISLRLTDLENPRTQRQYDNSVLYKGYLLSFVNNYSSLFYVAFFKGRLYGTPDTNMDLSIITKDSCQPSTCVVELCMLLFFLIVFKRMIGNVIAIILPSIKRFFKRIIKLKSMNETDNLYNLPQYEEEYNLVPTNRYMCTSEFCEMVIEFGFATFFVASFPLGPLLSLIKNVTEMRLDAQKLIKRYRRPVPKQASGIGAWDGVLLGLTYLSTATNAFVISFTSDFVGREVYRWNHNASLVGFVNSTLSKFDTMDYLVYGDNGRPIVNICYYRGMREPPTDPDKYELTSEYWMDITWRLVSVLIFEHIILVGNAFLSYAISDVPKSVKDQLNIDRQLAREAKLKLTEKGLSRGTTARQRKLDTQIGPISGYNF